MKVCTMLFANHHQFNVCYYVLFGGLRHIRQAQFDSICMVTCIREQITC